MNSSAAGGRGLIPIAGLLFFQWSNFVVKVHARCLFILLLAPVLARSEPLSVLNWNVGGNGALDWSTNAPQVEAIGRIVRYLQPDIVTFQEIPHPHIAEMTNFVKKYLPTHHLARFSGTDGNIRSVILSRHPIVREQKWLDGALLNDFGYDGRFTRDLFEAEIAVPGWPIPLHVFTTHLKSGFDADSVARRAAEALAISNYVANTYYPVWTNQPFLLTGDFNEDVVVHATSGGGVVPKLTHPGVGLRLTSPRNPITGSERTFSIRTSLGSRLDYILPNGLLSSNLIASQTFRTGLLNPLPAALLADDDRTASDHLAVWMVFENPYNPTFQITRIEQADGFLSLRWEAQPGRTYAITASSNLIQWTEAVRGIFVGGNTGLWNTSSAGSHRFFRVEREP